MRCRDLRFGLCVRSCSQVREIYFAYTIQNTIQGIVNFCAFKWKFSCLLAKSLFIDRSGICCGPRELFLFSKYFSLFFSDQVADRLLRRIKYPKYSPDLARITRGLHAWKFKPSRQNLVVFVFVLVVVLRGFSPDTSSSSVRVSGGIQFSKTDEW